MIVGVVVDNEFVVVADHVAEDDYVVSIRMLLYTILMMHVMIRLFVFIILMNYVLLLLDKFLTPSA
jgi:hypothetical protein